MEVREGYKQTEVGVIPEDWEAFQIGNHVTIRSGESPSQFKMSNGSIPYYKVEQISQGEGLIWPHQTPYSIEFNDPVLGGSLIFPKRGASIMLNRVRILVAPSFMDTNVMALTVNEVLSSTFLYFALLHFGLFQVADTTSIPQLNNKHIRPLLLPTPPTKAEQEAIAEALSVADALIESLEQLIAKKRQIKQGAMQELLTGKKGLPGFSGEWKSSQLGDVIEHCSSGATPYRGRPEFYKGTIRWISSGELNYNEIFDTIEHISEEAVRRTNLRIHPAGTFLIAITGLEAAGTRGSCGIIGRPAATNQSCMAIYPGNGLSTRFLFQYYVFRGNELALTYCQGTKQQSYTAKLVKILPIFLPSDKEEQFAIAAILDDMDAEIAALEGKLSKARQVKQGMMQELLTGNIRLVEPEAATPSATADE